MKSGTELLLVFGVAVLAAIGAWRLAGPAPRTEAPSCDPANLPPGEVCLDAVKEDPSVLWIDARTASEWRNNGLPGSLHLTTVGGEDFEARIAEIASRLADAEKIVVYCGDLGCGVSKEVAGRLRDYGLARDARALHGGWSALNAAGMIKGSTPAP